MKQPEKLVLIDGNALVHRSYHALPPLSHNGQPTNAVYGFASVLLKMIRELKPDYVIATFDLAAPTFRHEEFADYKAHRPKTPDDLIVQFEKVKEVVRAFSIPVFEKEGFEADDVVGTIAEKIKEQKTKITCIIITGDLDALQLVDKNTQVYTLKKGISDTVIYDEKAVRDRFGLEPSQMADFKGLKGDPSDNIPGVPGVGDKTATDLLSRWGSVENLFAHLDELPEKMKKKLEGRKDEALFSKGLATIRRDVPLELDLSRARFGRYDKDRVEALFKKLGFFTLVSRMQTHHHASSAGANPAHGASAGTEERASVKEASATAAQKLAKENELALTWDGAHCDVAKKDGATYRFPLAQARPFLESARTVKIGYDMKQLVKACVAQGIAPAGFDFDAHIAAYLLSPGERAYPLHRVLLEEEISAVAPHVLFALKEKLGEKLKKEGLWKLFSEIEMPLAGVLARMELLGIRVDGTKLKKLSENFEQEKKAIQKTIWRLAGGEFNIDSPLQMSQILFEKLGIKKEGRAKKTKTGMVSTKADELEKLRGAHPIIPEVLHWRELAKLKSTYVDALIKETGKDQRVHTIFSQTATATGRLSSSEPNLQNIPQKGEHAQAIRSVFIADEGFTFLSFDFSQIELRIVASLSGDEKMIRIFREGGDIHRATAAEINHMPPEKVTQEMRSAAKALNFGILYGMGERSFAAAAGIDVETARRFIEEYFRDFSDVARFIETAKKNAERYGFAQTLLGRKRWLPDIHSRNPMLRSSAERMAQNMPIQGLQADIVKIAMVRIAREILPFRDGVRLLLQIHDELVFEVKNAIIKEIAQKIRRIMEGAFELKVPIVVRVKTGEHLGEMHFLEL
ncbi:DNA polymerase I [Candidatus Azambacteria bacterium]|nr:DNA polymerase I [Candidatus Azambacteria bacterium]